MVKTNALSSAIEAACLILSIDETVRNPQSEAVRFSSLFLILLFPSFSLPVSIYRLLLTLASFGWLGGSCSLRHRVDLQAVEAEADGEDEACPDAKRSLLPETQEEK